MKVLVTGSSGHLGEALVRTLHQQGTATVGIDLKPSPYTDIVGSIADPAVVTEAFAHAQQEGETVAGVFHTATLHKPHVATHSEQQFVATNVLGTLNLLECTAANKLEFFVFTSTTSAFGDALRPPAGEPAGWITEQTLPQSKNIYGATKLAAEDLCRLYHRNEGLNCLVLRTSRFFPEDDDNADNRAAYAGDNLKANEFLYRRVELADVVTAHTAAAERASHLGFGCYIVSATSPFQEADTARLNADAASVVREYFPDVDSIYEPLGYSLPAANRSGLREQRGPQGSALAAELGLPACAPPTRRQQAATK